MAGSPCPPEVVKQVISVMGIKGITVSGSYKYTNQLIKNSALVLRSDLRVRFRFHTLGRDRCLEKRPIDSEQEHQLLPTSLLKGLFSVIGEVTYFVDISFYIQ